MNIFQILMLGISLYFAYQVYLHISNLEDFSEKKSVKEKKTLSIVDPEYLMERADKAFEQNDIAEALRLLREAHAKDSDNVDILNKLGFVLAKEGEYDEAISVYLDSLEKNAEDDMVHNAIASAYRSVNDFEASRKHYEEAIRIDDTYAITYFNFANLLVDLEELEEARAMYKKAIALDPEFTQAKFELEKLK